MFENEYRKQMDSIVPDEALKAKIQESFTEEPIKRQHCSAVIYRTGLAVAATIAIVLSVIFFPKKPADNFATTPKPVNTENGYLKVAEDYNGLYKHFKKLKKEQKNFDLFIEGDYAYEYATDGEAAAGSSTDKSSVNTNTTSKDDLEDFSNTTTQVSGVDEADIVKTDGKYIYSLYRNRICISRANGKDTKFIADIKLPFDNNESYNDMYISGNRLALLGIKSSTEYRTDYYDQNTTMTVIDISNPAKPSVIECITQSGSYNTSRMIDGTVYIVSRYSVVLSEIKEDAPDTYVPCIENKNGDMVIAAPGCIRFEEDYEGKEYVVACSYDIADGSLISNASILGSADELYCSTNNIIITAGKSREENGVGSSYSVVSRFAINDKKIEYVASGEVTGTLLNQFSMDEHDGYFRFVTTNYSYRYYEDDKHNSVVSTRDETVNALYVLNDQLKTVGKIENIAPDERVYSVRFMGDTAYFVTFRQVDPLFSVDLSDPENPAIIGSLKIPGFSDYLYPYGDGLLLGIGQDADEKTGRTGFMKISMFDISNPENVTESSVQILKDVYMSPALDSHKATLVSNNKNLIGFAVGNEHYDGTFEPTYRVYSFEKGEFKLLADLPLTNGDEKDHNLFDSLHYARGLFIGDNLYIVNEIGVWVYDINSMEKIINIKF